MEEQVFEQFHGKGDFTKADGWVVALMGPPGSPGDRAVYLNARTGERIECTPRQMLAALAFCARPFLHFWGKSAEEKAARDCAAALDFVQSAETLGVPFGDG